MVALSDRNKQYLQSVVENGFKKRGLPLVAQYHWYKYNGDKNTDALSIHIDEKELPSTYDEYDNMEDIMDELIDIIDPRYHGVVLDVKEAYADIGIVDWTDIDVKIGVFYFDMIFHTLGE